MNTNSFIAIFGLCSVVASIAAPVFSAMPECPSIKTAMEANRVYVDFAADVRLRLTQDRGESEVALRAISAFESNATIERQINEGQALTVSALDSVSMKPVVEVFTNNSTSGIDYVAVYHRANSAIVVSSFNGESPRCERLSNGAAADFVSDLAHAHTAATASLLFASSDQVYERLGL